MISVKVLGTGCKKCQKLEEKVKEVAKINGFDAEIIKVTDIQEIMKYKVMITPGLVINEQVVSYGIIPKDEQIIQWLKEKE